MGIISALAGNFFQFSSFWFYILSHQCSRYCGQLILKSYLSLFLLAPPGNTMGFIAPTITGILIKVSKNLFNCVFHFIQVGGGILIIDMWRYHLSLHFHLNPCLGPRRPGTLENSLLRRLSGIFPKSSYRSSSNSQFFLNTDFVLLPIHRHRSGQNIIPGLRCGQRSICHLWHLQGFYF